MPPASVYLQNRVFPAMCVLGSRPLVRDADTQPFVESLCHRCRFLRRVQSKTSTFLLCQEPSLTKYPPQPIVQCDSYRQDSAA